MWDPEYGQFAEKREVTGSATVVFDVADSHLLQQCMRRGSRLFGFRGHIFGKWQKCVWAHFSHCKHMVLMIHAGYKAENRSGEKAGRDADGRSTSFNWWYCWRRLVKVKLRGRKEGTGVGDSIHYNCLLRVFARGGGSNDCDWGTEHVLEGNLESSHTSYDDDTQGKI